MTYHQSGHVRHVPLSRSSPAMLLWTASLACAVPILDNNLVAIALPGMTKDLNAAFGDIQWVMSSYLLCFTALLLPAGAAADRIGRKRLLLIGLALFALASLGCAAAQGIRILQIARAGQGVGVALLLAPALAAIGHALEQEDAGARTRSWATWGVIMGLAMLVSPLIGGLVSQALGWRWAFLLHLPVCLGLMLAVHRCVPESRGPSVRTLDLPGIALFALAVFVLIWALISGPSQGWTSGPVLLRLFAGAGLLALFVRVERLGPAPILDLTLFRNRRFRGALAAMLAYAGTAQVMLTLLPLYLQNARGAGALQAGLGMLPFALAMLVFPLAGRRMAAFMPGHRILVAGLALVALGQMLLAWSASTPGAWRIADMIGMTVVGAGGGLLNGETQKVVMGSIPAARAGMASGISTSARFLGILVGFTVLGAVVTSGVRSALAEGLPGLGLQLAPGAQENLVAGNLTSTESGAGLASSALVSLVRSGFGTGFAFAFLLAAATAAIVALAVNLSMRDEPDGCRNQ